jgi:hypothetical protein
MKIREDFGSDLKDELSKQYSAAGNLSGPSHDGRMSLNSILKNIEEDECDECEGETTEMTSSGSAGGYSAPLFSVSKKDLVNTKKVEAKEMTSSSSSGQYDAPGFEDVNMKGNHPKGSGRSFKKAQIPGGSFVEVKSKCKKFPYCNQGDINALNITKENEIKKVLKNLSEKYQLTENEIKTILVYELKKMK